MFEQFLVEVYELDVVKVFLVYNSKFLLFCYVWDELIYCIE